MSVVIGIKMNDWSTQHLTSALRSLSFFINYSDFSEEPTEATAEEIRLEAEKWVNRSKCGASFMVSLFIAWVFVAQFFRKDLPAYLYLYSSDNAELTGW